MHNEELVMQHAAAATYLVPGPTPAMPAVPTASYDCVSTDMKSVEALRTVHGPHLCRAACLLVMAGARAVTFQGSFPLRGLQR